MSIPRLTAFRWSAGHYSGDGDEQQDSQDSQNDGLHDDCSVDRTADGML
jgi:hypothetical protein